MLRDDRRPWALVTGAANGIGLATVRSLAAGGYRVVAVDRDDRALAVADLPDGSLRVRHDISDVDVDLWSLIGESVTVEALVNNVAVVDGRSFTELPVAEAARVVHTNIVGTWAVSRAVVDRMLARGASGSVVFNLSLHSSRVRMFPDYSASKAALLMLMREMAVELAPRGIRVNAVSPGAIDTGSGPAVDGEGHRTAVDAMIPARRQGTPQDVARVITWLCSPEAAYVTGADIPVDGGLFHYNWLHHLYGDAATERYRHRAESAGSSE
jgi:NAD(P)-dependent dehydrogenase (short-subunit alcohol dehydrogenase family)